ncbi:hypothetical protein AKO1_008231 [Acrasis kona]|uniref:Uncharacterized protein n=1 Tax=Acrasis kona TaxID=1008807 RepID=A0AAW2YP23_9EUKA
MGNSQALSTKPRDVITIRYILMPGNTVGQINIANNTTLEEVQLLMKHLIPSLDKFKLKCEYFNGASWVVADSAQDWMDACTTHIKSKTIEPLQFKITKKPIPIHERRLSPLAAVRIQKPFTRVHRARAKLVQAPAHVQPHLYSIEQDQCQKVTNDELFAFVIGREPERRYLKVNRC